jgi:hypothetical protein
MDADKLKALEERMDRLEAQNRYLNDYIGIWKLQSLYCHYVNIGAVQEIVGLFADSPEVEIELSNKGVLRGKDAPHRYFLRAGQKDEIKSERAPQIPGNMVIHMAVNPALEIDAEGVHARAVWFSPGITNFPIDQKLTITAAWCWGKYDIEYLKQDGAWKILAFRWRQIFLSRYELGWVKENLEPGHVVAPPDRASAPDYHNPYKPDRVNRFDPPPPPPYPKSINRY